MSDHRDRELGDELERLRLPDHGSRFWDTVEDTIENEARVLYRARDDELGALLGSVPLPGHRDDFWPATRELLHEEARAVASSRRRPRNLVATVAAVAAAVLVLLWSGLPGPVGGTDGAIAHGFLPPLQLSLTPAVIDGDTLFWASRQAPGFDEGPTDVTVFGRDVTGGDPFAVSTHGSAKLELTSSGGIVAWLDDRDRRPSIYVRDIGSGSERRVAVIAGERHPWEPPLATDPSAAFLGEPAVDGARVVWADELGDVRGYDLATGTAFAVATAVWNEREPDISGDLVAWSDSRRTTWGMFDTGRRGWDIWVRDLETGSESPVCEAHGDQVAPAVSGRVVVWQDGRARSDEAPDEWDIYGRDLETGREFAIATGAGAQTSPAIAGNFVVWSDSGAVTESGDGSADYTTIQGVDLRTGRRFTFSSEPGLLRSPSVSGHRVVWSALGAEGELAVYGATISQRSSGSRVVPMQP